MDADKLADFGNIKTAHGDVKTAFRIFGFQGLLSLHNKDFLQCFIIRQSFSGASMYLRIKQDALSNISSDTNG